MLTVEYRLSRRQAKEFVTRGRQLLLALPLPAFDPGDLLRFARRALPSIDPARITSAEERELACDPTSASPGGVTGFLGPILAPGLKYKLWHVCIPCCVVTLTPERGHSSAGKIQWPGELWVNGLHMRPPEIVEDDEDDDDDR